MVLKKLLDSVRNRKTRRELRYFWTWREHRPTFHLPVSIVPAADERHHSEHCQAKPAPNTAFLLQPGKAVSPANMSPVFPATTLPCWLHHRLSTTSYYRFARQYDYMMVFCTAKIYSIATHKSGTPIVIKKARVKAVWKSQSVRR